jgi:hypothetical protein
MHPFAYDGVLGVGLTCTVGDMSTRGGRERISSSTQQASQRAANVQPGDDVSVSDIKETDRRPFL